MASHITVTCVIGCRIWPGPCYLNGPSRHVRSVCVCVYLLSCLYKICSCQASSNPVRWILVHTFSFHRITYAAGRSKPAGHRTCLVCRSQPLAGWSGRDLLWVTLHVFPLPHANPLCMSIQIYIFLKILSCLVKVKR